MAIIYIIIFLYNIYWILMYWKMNIIFRFVLKINKKEKIKMFKLHSEYKPTGDQPQAIEYLSKGIEEGKKFQTLLGVTGSRKNLYYG